MHRELLASICLTALAIGPGVAEEPRSLPGPHPLPLRMPLAAGAKNADQAIDHLLKAAEHLEAAGLTEEAAKIRIDARQRAVRDDVLSRKEAELECLQEEVDRLRALTGYMPTVLVDIVAVEVDRKKLGLKALDFD